MPKGKTGKPVGRPRDQRTLREDALFIALDRFLARRNVPIANRWRICVRVANARGAYEFIDNSTMSFFLPQKCTEAQSDPEISEDIYARQRWAGTHVNSTRTKAARDYAEVGQAADILEALFEAPTLRAAHEVRQKLVNTCDWPEPVAKHALLLAATLKATFSELRPDYFANVPPEWIEEAKKKVEGGGFIPFHRRPPDRSMPFRIIERHGDRCGGK